jgi:hypothetical protein
MPRQARFTTPTPPGREIQRRNTPYTPDTVQTLLDTVSRRQSNEPRDGEFAEGAHMLCVNGLKVGGQAAPLGLGPLFARGLAWAG